MTAKKIIIPNHCTYKNIKRNTKRCNNKSEKKKNKLLNEITQCNSSNVTEKRWTLNS